MMIYCLFKNNNLNGSFQVIFTDKSPRRWCNYEKFHKKFIIFEKLL